MYQPGHLNAAVILSRSPQLSIDNNQETEDYINYIANNAVPKAMTLDEIETSEGVWQGHQVQKIKVLESHERS